MPYLACQSCGFVRHTRPDAKLCVKCITALRRAEHYESYKARLDVLGFDLQTPADQIGSNKAQVSVYNRACQHTFTAQLENVLNGRSVCGVCGPKKRMAYALKFFIEKYGKDLDYDKFIDYRYQVRKLSERTYETHIDILNPQRLKRSRPDLLKGCVQLDHITPIIECFKQGWPPEDAAALNNLRVIDAIENLKKQRFT